MNAYIEIIKIKSPPATQEEKERADFFELNIYRKTKYAKRNRTGKQLYRLKQNLQKSHKKFIVTENLFGYTFTEFFYDTIAYRQGWNNIFTKEMFKSGGTKSSIITNEKAEMGKWFQRYINPKADKKEIIKTFLEKWGSGCIFKAAW